MENVEQTKQRLRELLGTQKLAVVSTNNKGWPYASLVGFFATDDLKELIFATARTTRKYANLTDNDQVAMLIDSRSNQDIDFHDAIATTALGRAEEISGTEREQILPLYIKKHPYLVDFVKAPSCALIRMKVARYYLVSKFQNVVELHITQ
jgi:nitroimidazol reductase NimA-like FMN-containing flavoprotein (pyridoxamine 5'-phosphate oxidase superfamily)